MVRSGGEIHGVSGEEMWLWYVIFVDSGEGRDWPGRGERHLVKQEAAVHRHSLGRLNTINEFPPPKKCISYSGQGGVRPYA